MANPIKFEDHFPAPIGTSIGPSGTYDSIISNLPWSFPAGMSSGGGAVAPLYVTVGPAPADYVTDGVADDVEIQQAINAVNALGGGVVFLKRGTYTIASSIKPKSFVHFRGADMFGTKITTISGFTGGIIADISFTQGNQLIKFTCSDMELDGTNMQRAVYSIGAKGIDSHFLQYCIFQNLYIHDTPATALGIDNLDRCLIDHIIAISCGTSGQPLGSNGIGIGTGGNLHESFVVSNCITVGIANSAYLCEEDDSQTVDRHYVFANNISYGDFKGLVASGSRDVIFANNQVFNPQSVGMNFIVYSSHVASRITAVGNEIDGAVSYGLYVDTGVSDCIIEGNRITNGTVEGAVIRGSRNIFRGNSVYGNGKTGVFLGAAAGGSAIAHVALEGNFVYNNSVITANTDGIRIDATQAAFSDITVRNNHCFDDQGTQTQRYGIIVTGNSAITNLTLQGNELAGNKTGALLSNAAGTITGYVIKDNPGYNPVGDSAISVTASPFTYTNGNTAADIYVSGGTVSSITKGGITIFAVTNTAVHLEPRQSLTVTYTVAPTMTADVY